MSRSRGPVGPNVRREHWDAAMAQIAPLIPKFNAKLASASERHAVGQDLNYANQKITQGISGVDATGLSNEYQPVAQAFMAWMQKRIRQEGGLTTGLAVMFQNRYNEKRDNGFPNPGILVSLAAFLGVTLTP